MRASTGTTQTRKAAARRHFLEARAARQDSAEETAAQTEAVRAYIDLIGARRVALYVSTGQEPKTSQLRQVLRANGVTVLLPVLHPDNTLSFRVDTGSETSGLRGVPIPTGDECPLDTADVVIVPALAVDRHGHRLGRGGGSYDRALIGRRAGAPILALLHPGEFVGDLPAEPHDVRVDAVALPDGVVTFPSTGETSPSTGEAECEMPTPPRVSPP